MPFINSFVCPKCAQPFPFFAFNPSIRINRGLLAPNLKCPNCGQISRPKIDVLSAAWVWPLTLGLITSIIYVIRTFLYRESQILNFLLVLMSLALFFIGLRRGFKLVPVEENHMSQSILSKWVIPLVVITLSALLLVYDTRDWLNVVLGMSIGLIVFIIFYYNPAR